MLSNSHSPSLAVTISKKVTRIVLFGLFFASVSGTLLMIMDSTSNEPIRATAEKMAAEFSANESSANQKYLGKPVIVTGIIKEIPNDDHTNVLLMGESADILAYFDKPVSASVGSVVSIRGICNGYLLEVILDKCELIE